MKRGTRVGQAYVALHVDGSSVNDDIAESVDDVDWHKQGKDARGRYEKGWSETQGEIKKTLEDDATSFEDSMKRIRRAVENSHTINQGIAKQLQDEFRGGDLDALFKHVGNEAGFNFGEGFDHILRQKVLDSLQEMRTAAAEQGKLIDFQTTREGGINLPNANFQTLVAAARDATADEKKIRDSNLKDAQESAKRLTSILEAEDKRRSATHEQELSRFLDDSKFTRFVEAANKELGKIKLRPKLDEVALEKARAEIAANLERQHDLRVKLGLDIPEREKAKLRAELTALSRDLTVHVNEVRRPSLGNVVSGNDGDGIGRFLGAGSRNNFLNLIGRSAGNLSNVFEGIFKGGAKILSVTKQMGGAFSTAFSEAEEGASFVSKALAGVQKAGAGAGSAVSEAFAGILASGPGAAIAIAAVVTAVSILISVLSALLAVVIALAATIATALVGALTVGAGALLALTVAGGLAVAMFTQLSDAQKKVLKADFGPVVERFRGLGQVLAAPIFSGHPSPIEVWAANIDKALRGLGPLAHIMGVAFGEAGKILTASLSGKGFHQFFAALSSDSQGLAPIIENMSSALGAFLNGVASLFAAVTPQIFQFSVFLKRVATEFADFASGADGGNGPNRISTFVDRAVGSLNSLMGFLGAVGGVLNKLLFSTQATNAGNTIFDSMTEGLKHFISFLTPERLQSFFDSGVSMAKALGNAIKTVALVLRDLNDAGVISGLVGLTKLGLKAVEIFTSLPLPIKSLLSPLYAIAEAVNVVQHALIGLIKVIQGALFGVQKLIEGMSKVPGFGWLDGAAKSVKNARDSMGDLIDVINGVPSQINIGVSADTSAAVRSINALIKDVNASGILDTIISGKGSNAKPPKGLGGLLNSPLTGTSSSSTVKIPSIHPTSGGSTIPRVGKSGFGGGSGGGGGADKAKQQADAIASIFKTIRDGIKAAATTADAKEVRKNLADMIQNAQDAAKDFDKAGKKRIAAVTKILKAQEKLNFKNVSSLVSGNIPRGATLEDFAKAREIVAARLEKANQKLSDAIALRDDFRKAVEDAVKSFGALTTAQAQTIDGVQQNLTATDITKNLQDRLKQIQDFQANLRILLAQGISQDAYKQILDAGVQEGGAFASALVAGGTGAVQQVNGLVGQINAAADQLGLDASNRMYQAGVDAAQGLVDGLESLSAKLDSAAVKLGNSIALAIKRALGIHSPSRRLRDMMDHAGDGIVLGLDNQHGKVGYAASRLSDRIAVSPEVAAYASSQGQPATSDSGGFTWNGNIVTPTEDPEAVVHEVVNEITGRL